MFRRYVWLPFLESVVPAAKVLLGYFLWGQFFHFLILSIVTYVMSPRNVSLQTISETMETAEFLILGLAGVSFLATLKYLYPLTSVENQAAFTLVKNESRFMAGFVRGSVLALFFATPLLFTGHYQYLGLLLSLKDNPMTFVTVTLKALSIVGLIYSEEFIFRRRVLKILSKHLSPWAAVIATSTVYCLFKGVQFDLGWMHYGSLFLIATFLGLMSIDRKNEIFGTGFWSGLLVTFHPVMSLPVLGLNFTGILLLHYDSSPMGLSEWTLPQGRTALFLTGGLGGPLSSFILMMILTAHIAWISAKHRKFLFTSPIDSIR